MKYLNNTKHHKSITTTKDIMYTAQFVFENRSTDIRRIRCTDNTIRVLAPDIFRTVKSSNKSRYLKQFTDESILKVYQCVPEHVLQADKKLFNTVICDTRTMTQEQTLTVLHRMELNPCLVSFRQWITEHFYDDIPPATEQDEEKLEERESKPNDIILYADEEKNECNTPYEEVNNINPFECFTVDDKNKILKTPYGDVLYAYSSTGQPAFRATDLTDILGYENSSQAIRVHVHSDYILSLIHI